MSWYMHDGPLANSQALVNYCCHAPWEQTASDMQGGSGQPEFISHAARVNSSGWAAHHPSHTDFDQPSVTQTGSSGSCASCQGTFCMGSDQH